LFSTHTDRKKLPKEIETGVKKKKGKVTATATKLTDCSRKNDTQNKTHIVAHHNYNEKGARRDETSERKARKRRREEETD
jgi:hypothetical protein